MHVREAGQVGTSELVARAKQGDRAAFDVLVERYTPRIYNLSLRITGSPEEAADCVQEAFLRAFTSLRRFRGEAAFSTWLYRVAVNVANDASRRLKNQPLRASELEGPDSDGPISELDRFGSALEGRDNSPEDSLLESQRREVIFEAIRSLPEHYRAMIVLYDLQGLSYEEISRVVGVRVGTVKSRLSRARLALKERLEPHLELLRG
jgi:RNA polymerase sigma-70 factor (ECF subfamily)